MASHDEYKKINDELVEVLRELLATGNWDANLFLRTANKKLQDLYQQAIALSKQYESSIPSPEDDHLTKTKQGFIKVYVSLYQSDPYSLKKWENTLKNIKEYTINRPIYRSEDHIREMIRSKHGSPNEAYIVIYIRITDIIPNYAGKSIEDRWGHELLTLRDNSLLPENILEFIHHGQRYIFKNEKLLLKSDNS